MLRENLKLHISYPILFYLWREMFLYHKISADRISGMLSCYHVETFLANTRYPSCSHRTCAGLVTNPTFNSNSNEVLLDNHNTKQKVQGLKMFDLHKITASMK